MNVIPFRANTPPSSDLSLQGKLECYQTVLRGWTSCLRPVELVVLLVVIDRTIGWGKREAYFTEEQLRKGDAIYCGMSGMSRATMFRVLQRLRELGIVRRRRDPKNPRKVYYSVNMDWQPEMLNVPECLQHRRRPDDSLTSETHIVSPVRPSKSRPCDTLYSSPETGNLHTVIIGSPPARPVPNPPARVRRTSTRAVAAHDTASGIAAPTSAATTSIEVEAKWKAAMLDAFPHSILKPWSIRQKAQVKAQASGWLNATEIGFPEFVDWAVRNWSGIIAKQFKWMTKSPPPAIPSISFFLSFLSHFADCWGEGKLDEWLRAPERTEMEQLLAAGRSPEEAAAEIGRRRAIEGMKEENEKVRVEARSRLRRAERAEKRTQAVAEMGGTLPVHPQSRAAKIARGELPATPRRMSGEEPQIDWNNQPTFDPNWEPPL